ncbi:MAG: ABC transporter ATP-binding protein, partial [Oscillospiraceae bacterium]
GEDALLQRMTARQQAHLTARRAHRRCSLLATGGLSALSELGYVLVLGWGAWAVAGGRLSFGTLTAILQLLLQLRGPVVGLAGTLPGFAAVAASAERLMELEDLPGEAVGEKILPTVPFSGLRMDEVSFSYLNTPVLQQFSGYVARGDCVALLGGSGMGKSTLLQLLLGFYTPQSGRLLVE